MTWAGMSLISTSVLLISATTLLISPSVLMISATTLLISTSVLLISATTLLFSAPALLLCAMALPYCIVSSDTSCAVSYLFISIGIGIPIII